MRWRLQSKDFSLASNSLVAECTVTVSSVRAGRAVPFPHGCHLVQVSAQYKEGSNEEGALKSTQAGSLPQTDLEKIC